jgi:hypothetical protein
MVQFFFFGSAGSGRFRLTSCLSLRKWKYIPPGFNLGFPVLPLLPVTKSRGRSGAKRQRSDPAEKACLRLRLRQEESGTAQTNWERMINQEKCFYTAACKAVSNKVSNKTKLRQEEGEA